MKNSGDKRTLDFFQAQTLLRQTKEKEKLSSKSRTSWLDSNDIAAVLLATSHDADEVYLPTLGKTFSIKYIDQSIWLQPLVGYTPSGWFTIQSLRFKVAESNVLGTI